MFADVLLWAAVPFNTIHDLFRDTKGRENDYYDSDDYDGNGTTH